MKVEEEFEPFDDERITRGLVTDEEIKVIEDWIVRTFFERAMLLGKETVVLENYEDYMARREEVFAEDPAHFVLFKDPETGIVDLTPMVHRLLDTKEGLFLAKWYMFRSNVG